MYSGTVVCTIGVKSHAFLNTTYLVGKNFRGTSVSAPLSDDLAVREPDIRTRPGMADIREVPVHGLRVD
jgi:hypothetical protein